LHPPLPRGNKKQYKQYNTNNTKNKNHTNNRNRNIQTTDTEKQQIQKHTNNRYKKQKPYKKTTPHFFPRRVGARGVFPSSYKIDSFPLPPFLYKKPCLLFF
jgi:hypothetical protein